MFIDSVNIRNMDIVNMSSEKPAYHHGDLRSKLIEMAISYIETDGASKLSLRKIAAQLGVSHNAPYMHFANKDALLDAVIARGFADLREEIAQAGGQESFTTADWKERVKSGFRAYVNFARERPALYALMHIPRGSWQSSGQLDPQKSDDGQAGVATLHGLSETLEAGQQLGQVHAGDSSEMALWVWATLHGLSSLTSEDRLVFAGKSPESVSEAVLDHLIQALAD